jgi:hypothetical protein
MAKEANWGQRLAAHVPNS